jgi:exocyst complex component 6
VQAFCDYYFEQRHLQLLSDLSPPSSMLEHHRTYLSHIAGFFILERKVLQSTDGLLSDGRISALWDAAVSSIKHCLDSGFAESDSTAAMLVLKDYVFLTATCLSRHLFDSGPLLVRSAFHYGVDGCISLLSNVSERCRGECHESWRCSKCLY